MQGMEWNKLIITGINILILLGLPYMMYWHGSQAKKKEHLSKDWNIQVLCVIVYLNFTCSEIPALWSRLYAYYSIHLEMPDSLYVLTTWDRWQKLIGYILLFVLTNTFTRNKLPKIIEETFFSETK